MKTNELDEILGAVYTESSVEPLSVEYLQKVKQQINKWALEKCLRVIGKKIEYKTNTHYSMSAIDEIELYNTKIERQRKKARKEFE